MTSPDDPVTILLISGSTRPGSTNSAALRTAAGLPLPAVAATLWERLPDVPAFVPEDVTEPAAAVTDLRGRLTEADAVVFCTPEYAGTLPGSLKNAIDWLVGSGELYRKPVAWINVAAPAVAPAPRQPWPRSSPTSTPTSSSRPAPGSRLPGT